MSTLNVANLELQINKKLQKSTDQKEIAILTKALSLLKTGTIIVSRNLPPVNSDYLGKIFYIQNPGLAYYLDIDVYGTYKWVPLAQDQINSMWSWGCNTNGQLGNCSTASRCSPGVIYDPPRGIGLFFGSPGDYGGDLIKLWNFAENSGWCDISNGYCHAMGLKCNGTLWTWGANGGRLGDGRTLTRSSPVPVFVGTEIGCTTEIRWCNISTSESQSAAIKNNGTLWTWGINTCGILGDGTTVTRCSPGTVAGGGTTWKRVSSGRYHMAAIKTDGTLWTWGRNICGALGDGTTVSRCSPGTVFGGNSIRWKMVETARNHTLAMDCCNGLWAWGNGNSGRLGDGTTVNKCSPTILFPWTSVSMGTINGSAIKSDGTLWLWGSNTRGQLGLGSCGSALDIPSQTSGCGTNWCQSSSGNYRIGAIKTDGTLWTWGYNGGTGGLGDGTTVDRCSPGTTAGGGTNWCQVCMGHVNLGAIKTDGTLWTWGSNGCGALGDGTTVLRCSPGTVAGGGTTWCQVATSGYHAAAIKTDGTLWTWGGFGSNTGVLGDGTATVTRCSPGTVAGEGITWCQVSVGRLLVSAIKTDGTLWSWGRNYQGQLGDGTTVNRCSPGTVAGGGTTWCRVSVGIYQALAIKTDGTLWTWGSNCRGSLGDGTTIDRCSPGTTAGGGSNWKSISSLNFNCSNMAAIKTDGTIWTWGNNNCFQLTDQCVQSSRCSPGIINRSTETWCQISSTYLHSIALKTDGTIWTWGSGASGRLGEGLASSRCCPGTVAGSGTTWCQASAGSGHSAAIKTDGTLWVWGCGAQGRLGDGATSNRLSPVSVGTSKNWCKVSSGFVSTLAISKEIL